MQINKLELNGWKQLSDKVWIGNKENKITIKNLKNSFSIGVYTEYGFESDKASNFDAALKSVEWFMNRRPQN